MIWTPCRAYTGMIGGCVFRNVPVPIARNGQAIINIWQEGSGGRPTVSTTIRGANAKVVAKIEFGAITIVDTGGYVVRHYGERVCVEELATQRIVYAFLEATRRSNIDFEMSMLTYVDGVPVVLHPDRICIGRREAEVTLMSTRLLSNEGGTAIELQLASSRTVPMLGPRGVVECYMRGTDDGGFGDISTLHRTGRGVLFGAAMPYYALDAAFEGFDVGFNMVG